MASAFGCMVCGMADAVIYCKSDAAYLCASCDDALHSQFGSSEPSHIRIPLSRRDQAPPTKEESVTTPLGNPGEPYVPNALSPVSSFNDLFAQHKPARDRGCGFSSSDDALGALDEPFHLLAFEHGEFSDPSSSPGVGAPPGAPLPLPVPSQAAPPSSRSPSSAFPASHSCSPHFSPAPTLCASAMPPHVPSALQGTPRADAPPSPFAPQAYAPTTPATPPSHLLHPAWSGTASAAPPALHLAPAGAGGTGMHLGAEAWPPLDHPAPLLLTGELKSDASLVAWPLAEEAHSGPAPEPSWASAGLPPNQTAGPLGGHAAFGEPGPWGSATQPAQALLPDTPRLEAEAGYAYGAAAALAPPSHNGVYRSNPMADGHASYSAYPGSYGTRVTLSQARAPPSPFPTLSDLVPSMAGVLGGNGGPDSKILTLHDPARPPPLCTCDPPRPPGPHQRLAALARGADAFQPAPLGGSRGGLLARSTPDLGLRGARPSSHLPPLSVQGSALSGGALLLPPHLCSNPGTPMAPALRHPSAHGSPTGASRLSPPRTLSPGTFCVAGGPGAYGAGVHAAAPLEGPESDSEWASQCLAQPQPEAWACGLRAPGLESCAVESRAAKVARYRAKRARRSYCKRVRYELRKVYASLRPRIRGRFVTPEELAAHEAAVAAGRARPDEA